MTNETYDALEANLMLGERYDYEGWTVTYDDGFFAVGRDEGEDGWYCRDSFDTLDEALRSVHGY